MAGRKPNAVKTETEDEVVATYEKIERLIDDRLETNEDGSPMLDEDGNQVVTKGLKTLRKEVAASQRAAKHAELDQYWLKLAKGRITEIPAEIQEESDAVYAEGEKYEAEIDAIVTMEELIAYENPVLEEEI